MNDWTLYTTPGCIQCDRTAKLLATLGQSVTTIDLNAYPEAHDYVTKELGYKAAPVVVAPTGEHWNGFRPDLIKAHTACTCTPTTRDNACPTHHELVKEH